MGRARIAADAIQISATAGSSINNQTRSKDFKLLVAGSSLASNKRECGHALAGVCAFRRTRWLFLPASSWRAGERLRD